MSGKGFRISGLILDGGIRFFLDTLSITQSGSLVFFAAVRSRGFEETYGRTFRRSQETRAERFLRSSILDLRSSLRFRLRGQTPLAQGLPQFLNKGGQGLAFNKLHGVEVDAAFAADEIDGHDVLMLEMGGCLGLVLEALKLLGVQGGGEGQHFQGDSAA